MATSLGSAHTRPEALFAGRYVVDGLLPWGGLIRYYRASAEGSPVIVSVLPMDVSRSLRAEAAFADFAQRAGSIRSASVPSVLDAGIIDGVPYLAFQDTRGTPLTDLLRDRSLGSLDILRLITDVLDALEAGHATGLTHGDLTPQNVVVTRDRHGRLSARVIGIGALPLLRAQADASAHAVHTGSGKFAIAYMAPELFGGGASHPSADLYAAGALLHHMVTGAPPKGSETDEGFEDMPELPDVVRRARAKRPIQRYRSAAAMRAALEWVEVESAKRSPQTQDIAPWMENSHIGSVPVPVLSSTHPPAYVSSNHPPGKVLGSLRPPSPAAVSGADKASPSPHGYRWLQVALLLLVLASLVSFDVWHQARLGDAMEGLSRALHSDSVDGE